MKRLPLVFRIVVLGALLLGLANLFAAFRPSWATDVHMLLGIVAALAACGILWPARSTGLGLAGMGLAAALLILGLGLRLGWWGGLAVGLVHLAVGLATIATVEMSAARARRASSEPR